mmetsp:Transcript_36242/g.50326  ORF Transcript_36242/g.50326 Transcript_36242/m.50326 type:complete len:211 (+) Transcript_36242:31-663(+)
MSLMNCCQVPIEVLPVLAHCLHFPGDEKNLINSLWILATLARSIPGWREQVQMTGCLPPLMNLLHSPNDDEVAITVDAIASIVKDNLDNQIYVCEAGEVVTLQKLAGVGGAQQWAVLVDDKEAGVRVNAERAIYALYNLYGPTQAAALEALDSALRGCPQQVQYETWARIGRAAKLEVSKPALRLMSSTTESDHVHSENKAEPEEVRWLT